MRYKRLDIPEWFRSAASLGQIRPHQWMLSPTIGRDGWYLLVSGRVATTWVEFEGVVYDTIGYFAEVLEQVTIAEMPLRDRDYQEMALLHLNHWDANLEKALKQEYDRRSARRSVLVAWKQSLRRSN